jgi:hypothetical protein
MPDTTETDLSACLRLVLREMAKVGESGSFFTPSGYSSPKSPRSPPSTQVCGSAREWNGQRSAGKDDRLGNASAALAMKLSALARLLADR